MLPVCRARALASQIECFLGSDPPLSAFYVKSLCFFLLPVLVLVVPILVYLPWGALRTRREQQRHLQLQQQQQMNDHREDHGGGQSALNFTWCAFVTIMCLHFFGRRWPHHAALPVDAHCLLSSFLLLRWETTKNNYYTTVVVVLFLIHPSITTQAFQMINCRAVSCDPGIVFDHERRPLFVFDSSWVWSWSVRLPCLLVRVHRWARTAATRGCWRT